MFADIPPGVTPYSGAKIRVLRWILGSDLASLAAVALAFSFMTRYENSGVLHWLPFSLESSAFSRGG